MATAPVCVSPGRWEWLSDSPSLLAPCAGAVSYYSQFGRVAGFTSAAGRRFRSVLEQHLDLLLWPRGLKVSREGGLGALWVCRALTAWLTPPPQGDGELAVRGEDGRLYHWILPSFFQLLRDLAQERREFAVVFRTFGSDLPRVLRALSRALKEGAHPLFPDLSDLGVSPQQRVGTVGAEPRKLGSSDSK